MKRIFTLFLTLTCLTALLSGCGSSKNGGQQTEPETPAAAEEQEIPSYTLDDIRESNSIENVLARHGAVTYQATYMDGDQNTTATEHRQYEMSNGAVQMNSVQKDSEGNVVYRQQAYSDDNYAGASYDLDADGQMYMMLYTNEEDYDTLLYAWLMVGVDGAKETITETSMQDDAVVISARRDYPDEPDTYSSLLYYIDPETNDLLYMEESACSTADDSALSTVITNITYDAPETFDVSPFETITGSSDYCEVNLIVDPQQDDMQAYWYPVAHGTVLYVMTEDGMTLYSDEELTQEIDSSSPVDISGAVRNIFAVRAK